MARAAVFDTVGTLVYVSVVGQAGLPKNSKAAAYAIDLAVRLRVRASGRCNVSSAVSELVRAGLVHRHYQGWRIDHHNRGARREAVYTLAAEAVGSRWLKYRATSSQCISTKCGSAIAARIRQPFAR